MPFLAALYPRLAIPFKVQADREKKEVKEYQLSSQTAMLSNAVTAKQATRIVVHLNAIRTVSVGGQQVREEPLQADITLVTWEAHGKPVGLAIDGFKTVPALSVRGEE